VGWAHPTEIERAVLSSGDEMQKFGVEPRDAFAPITPLAERGEVGADRYNSHMIEPQPSSSAANTLDRAITVTNESTRSHSVTDMRTSL